MERIPVKGKLDYLPMFNALVPWNLSDDEYMELLNGRRAAQIQQIKKSRALPPDLSKFFVINTTACLHGTCKYCYMYRNQKGFTGECLTKEVLEDCIDALKGLGGLIADVRELIVLGGEPSDDVDSLYLLSTVFSHAYLNVVTNGHWLNKLSDPMWTWVLRNRERIGITVSVDVPSSMALKGPRNDDVLLSLPLLVERGIRFSLRTTIYEENYRWLEWWRSLREELDLPYLENNVAWVERDEFNHDKELEEYIRYTIRSLIEEGDWEQVFYVRKYVYQFARFDVGSGVCDNRLSITPWGLINCCKPFGRRIDFRILPECYACEYLIPCGVMCWAEGRMFMGSCWYNKVVIQEVVRMLYGER